MLSLSGDPSTKSREELLEIYANDCINCVYGIWSHDRILRYGGQTKNPNSRIVEHVSDADAKVCFILDAQIITF
jgi:hypothetical protein